MKHLSDSERLTEWILRKKNEELRECRYLINQYIEQLETMSKHITELKEWNKILAAQVNYLISKHSHHA